MFEGAAGVLDVKYQPTYVTIYLAMPTLGMYPLVYPLIVINYVTSCEFIVLIGSAQIPDGVGYV